KALLCPSGPGVRHPGGGGALPALGVLAYLREHGRPLGERPAILSRLPGAGLRAGDPVVAPRAPAGRAAGAKLVGPAIPLGRPGVLAGRGADLHRIGRGVLAVADTRRPVPARRRPGGPALGVARPGLSGLHAAVAISGGPVSGTPFAPYCDRF